MLAYFSLRTGKTLSALCTNNTLFTYRQCKKSGVCAHLDEICDLNNNCSADWKQNHVILSGFQNLKRHIYHPSLRVVGVEPAQTHLIQTISSLSNSAESR